MRLLPLLWLLSLSLAGCQPTAPADGPNRVVLPTAFLADRVYVTPITAAGDTLRFFTDTGGGMSFVYPGVAARFGLRADTTTPRTAYQLPSFQRGAGIPAPSVDGARWYQMNQQPPFAAGDDGFLGRTWFADRIWQFDYPSETLRLLEAVPEAPGTALPLGFQTDSTGARTTHFPRMQAVIAGDTLDFLLDTGASLVLTDSATTALDAPASVVGTSFLVAAVFDRWQQQNPDWRVLEKAEVRSGAAILEVPEVTIAGHTVGPVWFTRRPDANFGEYMSQWMDQPIQGALGGSAFRYFVMTVDYPAATAYFARP